MRRPWRGSSVAAVAGPRRQGRTRCGRSRRPGTRSASRRRGTPRCRHGPGSRGSPGPRRPPLRKLSRLAQLIDRGVEAQAKGDRVPRSSVHVSTLSCPTHPDEGADMRSSAQRMMERRGARSGRRRPLHPCHDQCPSRARCSHPPKHSAGGQSWPGSAPDQAAAARAAGGWSRLRAGRGQAGCVERMSSLVKTLRR